MKLIIDTETQTLAVEEGDFQEVLPLYSQRSFESVSRQWLRIGWSLSYYMSFSWLGLPVIQIPEDLIRLQEAIHQIQPDFIVETGVYRCGSLLFHATICEAIGKGHVIGIDLSVDKSDLDVVRSSPLGQRITVIEGNSTSPPVFAKAASKIPPGSSVLVILDSSHTRDHVRAELELYSKLVTSGSYIAVADGLMQDLTDVPGGRLEWTTDNPLAAVQDFLKSHPEFEQLDPPHPFGEGPLAGCSVTHWPRGWLRRR